MKDAPMNLRNLTGGLHRFSHSEKVAVLLHVIDTLLKRTVAHVRNLICRVSRAAPISAFPFARKFFRVTLPFLAVGTASTRRAGWLVWFVSPPVNSAFTR